MKRLLCWLLGHEMCWRFDRLDPPHAGAPFGQVVGMNRGPECARCGVPL